MKIKYFLVILSLLVVWNLDAKIKLANILQDNMILQRNIEVKLWGNATPNQKLYITTSWNNKKTTTTSNGNGEWLVKVKTAEAGGPYAITITNSTEKVMLKNILLGEVWLCSGQSNMEMPIMGFPDQPVLGMNDFLVEAKNNQIRLFQVKKSAMESPQDTCVGEWYLANENSVAKFSAVGYLFAKQLQQRLGVPVGIILSSWGGTRIKTWMSEESLKDFPVSNETKPKYVYNEPSRLYNGMIQPILNFTIKGVLWYQGETNVNNHTVYGDLLTALICDWRRKFGNSESPFYYVQIAPYKYDASINSAFLREKQLKISQKVPNTGMISTIDIGNEECIHPPDKYTVAKRLSYWAIGETYGIKGVQYKNPNFKTMVPQDSSLLLSFENVENGLTTFEKDIENFEVAGDDKIFYPAKAIIQKQKVLVFNPSVAKPVAVRYCFCNFPKGKGFLYNTAGLPVPSFRSDNW